jgi:WD40 repeat protein
MSRHENSVLSVSWSADGKRLLTVGADRTARIWDAARERQLFEFREGPSSQRAGQWSPNGTHVVTFGSDNECRVYAAYTGDWSFGFVTPESEQVAKRDDNVLLVRWIRDATQILTVWRGGSVELRDSETGTLKSASLPGERLTSVSLSPDERQLLTMGESGIPRIRAPASNTELLLLGVADDAVKEFHWSPDGTRVLVVGEDGRATVWDASSGTFIAQVKPRRPPEPGEIPAAAWSPDGTRFLTCFEFTQVEAVRVWNATTGEALAYIPAADLSSLWSAQWSPDGRWIMIVDKTVRLIDPDSAEVVRVLNPGEDFFSPSLSFSPDRARVLIGLESGVGEIWELESKGEALLLRGHEDRVHLGTWSADGAQVLTVSDDATARVWNATDGKLVSTLRGHGGPVWDGRWSRDDRLILTRSKDHSARIWDAKSGEPIVQIGGTDDPVERAEWHPRAYSVLVHGAMGAWIWDIDLGVASLLTKTRSRVSRRLTSEERRSYGLPAGAR